MDKPIEHSYCVFPGKVYAGEYAGDLQNPEHKIRRLEEFGITHFIDLTEEGELNPYQHLLDSYVEHHRFPIKDVSVPESYQDVYDLMEYIDSILSNDENKVYVHCWGGVGRTGTIVACLYEYYGESYENAVNHLRQSFKDCPKSHWRHTPETEEQLDFIREFGIFLKERGHKKRQQEYTPENINSLKPNEVFVFGSNLDGNHGGGAARAALKKFGAIMGQGVGLQGQSYAIPTMQGGVETIKPYVDEFISFAKAHPELKFYVTRIGCGIAGFKDEEIAPLFASAKEVKNIVLPESFVRMILEFNKADNSLERFIEGQKTPHADYEVALNEVRKGRKISHWIWYIFPQLRGLGQSKRSYYYGIANRQEAEAYLRHPVLGKRLREITGALLEHEGRYPQSILGRIDALKVQSCMTLFDSISPDDIFAEVLDAFYEGIRDPQSIV